MRTVPYVDLAAQYRAERDGILACVDRVFGAAMFIDGVEVSALEEAIAGYCGTARAVAVNSGTDALILTMKAMGIGPGDEVVTPPNSFIASTSSIVHAGARPVFVDVGEDLNIDAARIEAAITDRTKAIMAVHLTGRVAAMDAIGDVARRHGLKVIEDAAQAMGSELNGRRAGGLGDAGCFSAHPLKNFNAAGDAGFVCTDDEDMADRVKRLRNHGLQDRDTVAEWGVVSRMDTVQAAILLHRLDGLDGIVAARRRNAALYREALAGTPVTVPQDAAGEFNSYHTFVIQADRRDALRAHLEENGVMTAIHYPVPLHLQPAARSLGHGEGDFPVAERQAKRILSLPIHQYLDADDIAYVAETVAGFYAR